MRELCRLAALLYDSGRHQPARRIFQWILKKHLPWYCLFRFYFLSTFQLASLVHVLAFPERVMPSAYDPDDLKKAELRLRKKRMK